MANPATTADIEARWRPLSDEEIVVAATLLDDAWSILQNRSTTIVTRLDAIPIGVDINLVRMVLASMVLRVMRNPEGKTQESIEDYSYTINERVSAGWLYVSADELTQLVPTASANTAFTITPYHLPDPLTWV